MDLWGDFMNKQLVSSLLKTLLFGVVWSVIGFIVAIVFVKTKHYILKDVLFIEGIILIAISILSSIGGNPTGLSLQSFGNPSLSSFANLEVTKHEKEKNPMKQTLSFGFSTISLAFGGLLLIFINFVI